MGKEHCENKLGVWGIRTLEEWPEVRGCLLQCSLSLMSDSSDIPAAGLAALWRLKKIFTARVCSKQL